MAIKSFPKNTIILIAGGYERHQEFEEMVELMIERKVKQLIALPTTGQRLVDTLAKKTNHQIKSQLVATIEEAVALAQASAQTGDIVLLSPASASYNSFKSYEERGIAFRQAIKQQAAKKELK
jgi:UDP-N-acetylmuramoylalanine--D-glutamate ligase